MSSMARKPGIYKARSRGPPKEDLVMDWVWQPRAEQAVRDAWRKGYRAVCLQLFTGGGKTMIGTNLIRPYVEAGQRAIIYSNRRILTDQIGNAVSDQGLERGFFAAGFYRDRLAQVQIVSAQTANRREHYPEGAVVLVDEAHRGDHRSAVQHYLKNTNAVICGLTATPVDMEGYEHLIIGGTKVEGRDHGAIVKCLVYAPSEPDIRGVRMEMKKVQEGSLLFSVTQSFVFADVLKHWMEIQRVHRLHFPKGMPTILWCMGVPESRWFAEEFTRAGYPWAHIDGDTSHDERDEIHDRLKCGDLMGVSSMGVMREGVDWPFLTHGIMLQKCGEAKNYVQCVGRILRACEGKPYAVLQDHSGLWHRHGSPNKDIEWSLTETDASLQRKLAAPPPKDADDTPEGIVCPKCRQVRMGGKKCPGCGYEHTKSVRRVMTEDGKLVEMEGSPNYEEPRTPPEDARIWQSCLFRAGRSNCTVKQAAMFFHQQTKRWPDGLPNCPISSIDWGRKVAEIFPWTARKVKT